MRRGTLRRYQTDHERATIEYQAVPHRGLISRRPQRWFGAPARAGRLEVQCASAADLKDGSEARNIEIHPRILSMVHAMLR